MALDGTTDIDTTVSDPTPLGDPATQAELDAAHTINITSPAAMDASSVEVPADIDVGLSAVENKITVPGVNAGSVSYTPLSTIDEINNISLNKPTESLKESINTKLTALAQSVTSAVGTVNSDMTAQVSDINTKLGDFKTSLNDSFASLKQSEIAQNDGIASEINRIAGTLLQNINRVAEGVADAQTKISALNDVYDTDADAAARIAHIGEMIDTLRGTDLSALQAIDGVIDKVNNLTRIYQKEVEMNAATGRYNYNLPLEGNPTFESADDYVVTANVINNQQSQVFIENKGLDGFDLLVKSYGRHYVPQPVDGSTTPVKLAVSISYSPTVKLTYVVPAMQADQSGTDDVTVGYEAPAEAPAEPPA